MMFLKYIFGEKEKAFTVPDGWHDVPYHKFVEFNKHKDDPLKVYEIFTGLSAEYWSKPHNAKLYASIDGQLAFLSEEPKTELPTHIHRLEEDEIGNKINKYYKIKRDLLNVPLGKYRDLIELTKQVYEDAENQLEIFPKMVAIFGCDRYEDPEELEEISKEIELMPTDLVYTLCVFFCQKLNELNNGTERKWRKVILQQMLTILKQALTKFLKILVICILFIISPKVTLQSTKDYLEYLWLRYTKLRKYRIVSTNPKSYTTI